MMKTGMSLIGEIEEARAERDSCSLWWLGQMGYALALGGAVLYIDAYLSLRPDRQVAPLLRPEEIADADLVLGTHNHGDHIDRQAWPALAKASPRTGFIVPAPFAQELSGALGIPANRFLAAEEGVSIHACGVTVTPVAAAHELLEFKDGKSLHLSYVLECGGLRLLHTGDACIYEGYLTKLARFGHFDAVILPINGRDAVRLRSGCIGNMTYQEAVDLIGALRPSLAIPSHYDMFANNSCDPELFREYLGVKYPGISCLIGGHGEKITLARRAGEERPIGATPTELGRRIRPDFA